MMFCLTQQMMLRAYFGIRYELFCMIFAGRGW